MSGSYQGVSRDVRVLSSDARNASGHIKGVCLSIGVIMWHVSVCQCLVWVCQGLSDREGL